jgi:hypothetical protein
MICRITDPAGQHCFTRHPTSSLVAKSLPGQMHAARCGTQAKEAGTKGAGISDAARPTIRQAAGDPNSPSWSAIVTSWSPKRSPLRSLAGPIWDAAKGTGTKGAGISDTARRAIHQAKSNPHSRDWSAAVRSWSPKSSPFAARLARSGTLTKGTGTKGAGISDAARPAIRRAKGNHNSQSPRPIAESWRPMR